MVRRLKSYLYNFRRCTACGYRWWLGSYDEIGFVCRPCARVGWLVKDLDNRSK